MIKWARGLVPFFVLAAACTAGGKEPASSEPSIYYATQKDSDRALENFGQSNPGCQLWTNWQKLCSRTGSDRSVQCISDARKSVRPSTPFCVAKASALLITTTERTPSQLSALRYCAVEEAGQGSDSTSTRAVKYCHTFSVDRPFSKFRPDIAWHSWCSKASGKDDFGRFRCIPNHKPEWCKKVAALGDVFVPEARMTEGEIDIAVKYRKNYSPISSIYCSIEKE